MSRYSIKLWFILPYTSASPHTIHLLHLHLTFYPLLVPRTDEVISGNSGPCSGYIQVKIKNGEGESFNHAGMSKNPVMARSFRSLNSLTYAQCVYTS